MPLYPGPYRPYEGPEVKWDNNAPLSRSSGRGRGGRGESAKSSEALAVYAAMGTRRSLERMQRLFVAQQEDGESPPTTSLSTLFAWSARFAWRERVQRFDDLEHEADLRELAEERVEERRRRIILLRALRVKVSNALTKIEVTDAKWGDVLAGVRLLTEQMRIEFHDDVQQHSVVIQQSGDPGLSDVPDELLDAVIKNLLAAWKPVPSTEEA